MSYVGKLYQSRCGLEFNSIDHVTHKFRTVSLYPEGEIFFVISENKPIVDWARDFSEDLKACELICLSDSHPGLVIRSYSSREFSKENIQVAKMGDLFHAGEVFTPISFCVQVMWNGQYLYMRKDAWKECISLYNLVEAKPR